MIRIRQGDCRDVLATLPAQSVHCCVTSPPYFGLRDYGTARWDGGDPGCKHIAGMARKDFGRLSNDPRPGVNPTPVQTAVQYRTQCNDCGAIRIDSQIGLEPTPEAYVAELVAVFGEVRRVLRDDGTLWLNLGDSYANTTSATGARGGSFVSERAQWSGETIRKAIPAGLKQKDLIGIPWRVAFALQADGWYLRQDIIWSKPNPMPESVTDRCTKAHEYMFLLSKSARYFYDAAAIAEPVSLNSHGALNGDPGFKARATGNHSGPLGLVPATGNRNKRSVWEVASQPFAEAHFATFPPDLIEPCIKAGTSEKGCCAKCGAPSERMMSGTPYCPPSAEIGERAVDRSRGDKTRKLDGKSAEWRDAASSRKTLGWLPPCKCDAAVVPCTVLDPFGGAGTTGLVADRLGRNALLIELNPAYAGMAGNRIRDDAGMFAEIA